MAHIARSICKQRRTVRVYAATLSDVSAITFPRPLRRNRGLGRTITITTLIALTNTPSAASFAAAATAQTLAAAHAAPVDPFADFILEAARRFDVPAVWIRAVMRAESRGERRATSPKGAMGLMQIMPSTWTLLRGRFNLGADPYDPRDNILAGAGFLRELRDRYGSPGFLAAYNAGPGRYEEYLKAGRPLPAETWAYIETIAPSIDGGTVKDTFPATSAVLSWTQAPLFVSHDSRASTDDRAQLSLRPDHNSNGPHVVDISAFAPQADGLFARVSAREGAP